ncbi:phage tail protein [Mesobaculum littorinae]|uniref:Phage tail protein n=1 Tax=Mesobaculum littorinae TaxID=2486419 RepID=A0A438AE58_9RHOB|nr:tail fiber protein [Mesobaculum littorinae]RVV96981.1 phage tail protein [Mesobaculum littorinae]
MSEPFIGEIRMFAGNFAPKGWAFCEGQLLPVYTYQALFSLIGTTYGGDGRSSFGLPDMRGRLPVDQGSGPALTQRTIGERSGSETVTLGVENIPPHIHAFRASTSDATLTEPQNALPAKGVGVQFYREESADVPMADSAIGVAGGNHAHYNMMPALCVTFIISLIGIYPSRS